MQDFLEEREQHTDSENEQSRHQDKTLKERLNQDGTIATELVRDAPDLQRKLSQLSEDRQRFEAEARQLAGELHAVKQSASWQLTAPLRAVSRIADPKTSRLLLPLRVLWWLVTLQLRTRMRLRAEKKLIAESRLFDPDFYLRQNPDAARSGMDPLEHYLISGAKEGRNPNPLFDTSWYAARNPDIAALSLNPLLHYVQAGWKEGRNPGPLFDIAFYLVNNPDVAKAGMEPLAHFLYVGGAEGRSPHPLFDAAFYLQRNPDLARSDINPLSHYILYGWKEGRNPHPLFDTSFYLERNPDVANTGVNPLVHYVQSGWQAGRDPHPVFDTNFYLERNPDVAQTGINPLIHFLQTGWLEKRDPHPLFETAWYLQTNPDVAKSGANPLLHYQLTGWKERRSPGPFFDGGFYLDEYPNVASGMRSSLEHYLLFGVAEKCNPSRGFDTDWYRRVNHDVLAAGVNPLVHYVLFGRFEKRRTRPLTVVPARASTIAARNVIPRVVFISGENHTPGHQYRVLNIADSLPRSQFETAVIGTTELQEQSSLIASADLLWIWRAPMSGDLANAIDNARRKQAKVIFDVDDLMFRPELGVVEIIDGIRSQGFSQTKVQELYSNIQATLLQADYCTVPTESLARQVRNLWKPATVIPNGFDRATFELSRTARDSRTAQQDDGLIRIGYAAGSRTHQRDFGLIVPALAAVLSENSCARLVLFRRVLVLEEFPELQQMEAQIEWRDLAPLEKLPFEYARFDINVAPLEVGNPFCEAKSELKFFEAALVGVPTIASPTRPFAEAIRHGETGFLAKTGDEWYECLARLVRDRELRESTAKKAYNEILWRYGPERRSQLATRLVNRLLGSASVNAELFAMEIHTKDHARLPDIAVPEYDVLFESGHCRDSRVSIIIPVFNYAHYLEGALESVRSQTCRQLDVIVVDDQSTDNSLDVACRWLKQHSTEFNRAALLRNRRNSKLGATRNAGVSFSDTELFFPLDPDNLLLPDCIEKCLTKLDETGAAYVYPTIEVFGDRSGEMGIFDYEPACFQCSNYVDAMALIRKAAWIAVGGYSRLDFGWEDFEFWCKLAEAGMFGAHLADIAARYRTHGSSMLVTTTDACENKKRVVSEINSYHPWLDCQGSI